jgi:hypothetical protein
MHTRLDHLVVATASLEEGAAWCEATLGVAPGPGGRHPLFGTHNRLLRIATRAYPRAYLEIIAIDPGATTPGRRPGPRWFDLDDAALRARLRDGGPQLVHWVAATDDVDRAVAAWGAQGIDRGAPLAASREVARGTLRWRITVRDDGARLFDGALPTLIQWDGAHPADDMPGSGVHLTALRLTHPRADVLRAAFAAVDLGGVTVAAGTSAAIVAELSTPKGSVVLASKPW